MNSIPKEVEILFENFQLDLARFLIMIYSLTLSRKKIKLEEYIFHELISVLKEEEKIIKLELRYKYFKLSETLPNIIIYLEQNKYIDVISKNAKVLNELYINITNKGKRLVLDLESEYCKNIMKEIENITVEYSYSRTKYKEVLEMLNEGD